MLELKGCWQAYGVLEAYELTFAPQVAATEMHCYSRIMSVTGGLMRRSGGTRAVRIADKEKPLPMRRPRSWNN